jgi:sulfate transport system substrate-binding protein
VREGLKADIVSLALAYDIDALKSKKLIPDNWQTRFPNNSAPFTSTVVFLVRKNNPKNIKNWDDLVKPGVRVITPSPKTSGAGRLNFLAAYAFALKKYNANHQQAKEFIQKFYGNVPVLDAGARTAGTTFMERNLGDVLVTWENEALLAIHKSSKKDQFEVVVPPMSLLAEPPVTYIEQITQQKKNTAIAKDFINFLYTPEAQMIFAKNYFRPRDSKISKRYQNTFPTLNTLRVQDLFVSWENAHELYFRDGALFDQIYLK